MAQFPSTPRNQGGRMATGREHPLQRMRGDFETLFDRLLSGWLGPFGQDVGELRVWDFDVTENDKEIMVRAEVPGFEPNELDVQLNNDTLTIKAEKEKQDSGREEYRSFYRTVVLPAGIDANKVQATHRNGVLELHIPRAEGAQSKRITIQGQQAAAQPTGQPTGTTASAKATK